MEEDRVPMGEEITKLVTEAIPEMINMIELLVLGLMVILADLMMTERTRGRLLRIARRIPTLDQQTIKGVAEMIMKKIRID